jgi:protein-disulfide isomerase
LKHDTTTFRQIIGDWFEKGKLLKGEFFKDLDLDLNNPAVETEFQQHEAWREKTQIRATPTILVNGYQLPDTDNYKIEDLRYFTILTIADVDRQ